MADSSLTTLLVVWMSAVGALVAGRLWRKTPGVGLILAYVLNLWLIHWLAPALYLLPGYENLDPQIVRAGLEQSTYAILAFVFGGVFVTPFLLNLGLIPMPHGQIVPDARLPMAYIALGMGSYLIMSLELAAIPSATSIFSAGQELVVVGLSLSWWYAWKQRDARKMTAWLGVSLMFPFLTILTRGFIGYGAVATLSVLIFVSGFVKSRVNVVALGLILAYTGLSVYVTYMRDRSNIRDTVWGGQSYGDRIGQLQTTFTDFEWFDLSNRQHLQAVDVRLNQSYLTGLAVNQLSDSGDYARGGTLWEALVGLIPRALWPEKPSEAGSGNLVSKYTGLTFATDTSVGVGQVMEFYINFGTIGVLVGFLVMGVLVTVCDATAADHLAVNDLRGFVLWYLPGLSLLQVGGSFVEVTVSTAAGLVVAVLSNKYLERLQRQREHAEAVSRTAFRTGIA